MHTESSCEHFSAFPFPHSTYLLLACFRCKFCMIMTIFHAHFCTFFLLKYITCIFYVTNFSLALFNGCITVHNIDGLSFNNFFYYLFRFVIISLIGWCFLSPDTTSLITSSSFHQFLPRDSGILSLCLNIYLSKNSHTLHGNVNWCGSLAKQFGINGLKVFKMFTEGYYEPAIPLPEIHPNERT